MPLEKTNTPGIYKSQGKRKTTFQVMYLVRVTDPNTARGWKWKPKGKTFQKFQDALTFKIKNSANNRGGQNLEPTDMTVEQLCQEWLEYKKPSVAKQTYKFYGEHVGNYLIPEFGNIKATYLTPQAIRSVSIKWQERVEWNTVNGVLGTLNRIFKFALREHDFRSNPLDKVDRYKGKRKEIEVYTANELNRLLAGAEAGLEKALFMTATHTGLRPAELCGLCWDVVNLKEGTLEVKRSLIELSKDRGGVELGPPKNKNAYRKVNLPPDVIAELRRWKLACPPTQHGYVFATILGKPIRKNYANLMLKRCCQRVDVKVLTMKGLRHTFASQHVAMGTSLPEVSKMMGHHSISFTLDTYTHWTKEKSNAQVALADLIKQAVEE